MVKMDGEIFVGFIFFYFVYDYFQVCLFCLDFDIDVLEIFINGFCCLIFFCFLEFYVCRVFCVFFGFVVEKFLKF